MPIFGSGLTIIVGGSGSRNNSTASFAGLNFIYTDPRFGAEPASSSIGSIGFNNVTTGSQGAAGAFQIKLPNIENPESEGVAVFTLAVTSSASNPVLGIGTPPDEIPIASLDVRSPSGSAPANIVLRTNEDGQIFENEETGKIIFLIESSSFVPGADGRTTADFISSGSTAEIFSRVKSTGSYQDGVFGNLYFQVNDADSLTDPVDILELGYGSTNLLPTMVGAQISGSLQIVHNTPYVSLRDQSLNEVLYLGTIRSGSGDLPVTHSNDGSELRLYSSNASQNNVKLTATGNSYISNSFNRLGVGTQSPSASIDIVGNLRLTGTITASALSASNNIDIGGRFGKGENYIDFSGNNNEIEVVILDTGSLIINPIAQPTGSISASGLFFASASLGPGTDTLLTYDTSSGRFFFTSSKDVGQSATSPNLQAVTNQGTITTAAITASIFSASSGVVRANTISSSGVHMTVGNNAYMVLSGSQQFCEIGVNTSNAGAIGSTRTNLISNAVTIQELPLAGGITQFSKFVSNNLWVSGNISSSHHLTITDVTASIITASVIQGTLVGNSNSVITGSVLYSQGEVVIDGNSGELIVSEDALPILSTGSAGFIVGSNNKPLRLNAHNIETIVPFTASLTQTTNTASFLGPIIANDAGSEGGIHFGLNASSAGKIYSPAPANLIIDASGSKKQSRNIFKWPN